MLVKLIAAGVGVRSLEDITVKKQSEQVFVKPRGDQMATHPFLGCWNDMKARVNFEKHMPTFWRLGSHCCSKSPSFSLLLRVKTSTTPQPITFDGQYWYRYRCGLFLSLSLTRTGITLQGIYFNK